MKWFMNLSTGAKLALGFISMMALLAVVIAVAYSRITLLRDSQKRLHSVELANVTDLLHLRAQHNGLRGGILAMMTAPSRAGQEQWHKDIKDRTRLSDQDVQTLLERNRGDAFFLDRLNKLSSIQN